LSLASGQAMARRDKPSGKPPKVRREKARRNNALKIPRPDAAAEKAPIAQLRRERDEALEWQNATGEILSAIDASTTDPGPVFDAIVKNLIRLFGTKYAVVTLIRDGKLELVGIRGEPGFEKLAAHYPVPLNSKTLAAKVIAARRPVQLVPIIGNPESPSATEQWARQFNYNSQISVPLIRQGVVIGSISTAHRTAVAFTDSQVELIQNFAAQAVIAIENTRLLNELRQRTDDLSEALEQQTATSEVLKVISTSPGQLDPVFDALLANATRLCGASYGAMWLREESGFRNAAFHGPLQEAYTGRWRKGMVTRADVDAPMDRIARSQKPLHIADLRKDRSYLDGHPLLVAAVDVAGIQTYLGVPMLKADELVGVIAVYGEEVRPFTNKQIELLTNFAAQAVIAIDNARLLNELRESLQQQTATADVLKVISKSPGELKPVFEAMLESAVRICGAKFGNLWLCEGNAFRVNAMHGAPDAYADFLQKNPVIHDVIPGTALGRVASERQAIQIPDAQSEKAYTKGTPFYIGTIELARARTVIAVPLLKEDELVGTIVIFRQEVRPFTDKQIELLTNFASQAVIAIENARLLNELRQRTRELTASLDNLRTTQDRLVQTQKLALLGQLTAGIAHEIKNPLNFVNNFSGISAELIDELRNTLKGAPLDDKARAEINELTDTLKGNFDKVVHHGRRADAIVKNMLQHSREGSGEHRQVDINALVEESLNLAWHGARAETQGFEIKLRQSFDPSAGDADIFPQDIRRALLNMISNGFYAATRRRAEINGGDYEPTLTASTKDLGNRVEIRIRDNGTGMTADVKEKMFNPFFTTKPTGEGTGLGLSISHDIIVKQHGGSIEVDTQPGEFTEIMVILPRVAVFV